MALFWIGRTLYEPRRLLNSLISGRGLLWNIEPFFDERRVGVWNRLVLHRHVRAASLGVSGSPHVR